MPCNIEARAGSDRLQNWHVACCGENVRQHRHWAALRPACRAGVQAFEGKAIWRKTTLTISSKNYSSWSLRGWLLTKFSGLEFEEIVTAPDDASARAEILLLSSSILVPCLRHDGATVWDTLAIARIPQRDHAGRRPVAGGPHPARALPLDLR